MTELTKARLAPCPFCGGTDLVAEGDDKVVGYCCRTCEATGPNHYDSRFDWNQRATTSAGVTEEQTPASNIGLAIAVKYLKGAPGIYLAKEISDAITAERRAVLEASRVDAPVSQKEAVARDEDNMPERIWAGDFNASGFGHCVAGPQGGLYAEYVRADLASPSPAPAGEPGIKALEWKQHGSWTLGYGELTDAYVVRPCLATRWAGQWLLVLSETRIGEFYPTEEAAKAAAQADYERRIRSALVHPAPVSTPVGVGCLTDVVGISADIESKRVLKLHFNREVTDADRTRLVDLHNAARTPAVEGK